MKIDHFFMFSKDQGHEAAVLKTWGLAEGSNRKHTGKGTMNRKHFFENYF